MQCVPLSFGRPVRELRTVAFHFLEVRHPLGMVLRWHEHDHDCINLVLDGCYHEQYARTGGEFPPLSIGFKPAGEPHLNRFLRAPARCLVIEILDREFVGQKTDRRDTAWTRDPRAVSLALSIWRELGATDDSSRLAIEELALGLCSRVLGASDTHQAGSGRIRSAVEALHDLPNQPWTLSQLAGHVDLHPSHLARAFRARQGCTVGEYLRSLRLNEVARRLALGGEPIAMLSALLAFADQSHCTRAFRARFGTTPARYRRSFQGWRKSGSRTLGVPGR